jgi:ABC-2 type transport system ATP-binding protein
VLRLRERLGTTMLLTTHYLDEADTMAERVLIIDHGRIIAAGTPDRLKADLAGDLVTLTASDEVDAGRIATIAERAVATHGSGAGGEPAATVDGPTVRLRVADGDALLPALLRHVDRNGIEVVRAHVRRPTLDDVFLHLTGRSLREDTTAGVESGETAGTTEVAA